MAAMRNARVDTRNANIVILVGLTLLSLIWLLPIVSVLLTAVRSQGDLFAKQEQIFAVVAMGPTSLLSVDLDVEVSMPIPAMMVKKVVNDALDHLAGNLKARAEQLASGGQERSDPGNGNGGQERSDPGIDVRRAGAKRRGE